MTIEKITYTGERVSDRLDYEEVEKQFHTVSPEIFEPLKDISDLEVIEQLYLSHPDEPYSLRLRQSMTQVGMVYTAALKDRGKVGTHGLLRMEIPAEISEATYQYYRSQLVHPVIHKLRASPMRDVIVDWTEGDDRPVIEIENLGSSPDAQRDRKSVV